MIFEKDCAIILTDKDILPCSGKYSFYNPTHLIREFSSGCGLQTSRFPDEGSEKQSGVYPPASCGFYTLYDGKAVYFLSSAKRLYAVFLFYEKLYLQKNSYAKRTAVFYVFSFTEAICLYLLGTYLSALHSAYSEASLQVVQVLFQDRREEEVRICVLQDNT